MNRRISRPFGLGKYAASIQAHIDEEIRLADEIAHLRRALEIEQALAAEDREKYQAEIIRLTNELVECRRTRWHHSPDAPPEHFCEDCDSQQAEITRLTDNVFLLSEEMIRLRNIITDSSHADWRECKAELARLRPIEEAARAALARVDEPIDWDKESPEDRFDRFVSDIRAALGEEP